LKFQGCQIFLGTTYQNGKKYTKLPQNVPDGHTMYHFAAKQTKWSLINANIFHRKAFQNLPKYGFFGFESIPIWQPCFELRVEALNVCNGIEVSESVAMDS
jgi:hypothetical protein